MKSTSQRRRSDYEPTATHGPRWWQWMNRHPILGLLAAPWVGAFWGIVFCLPLVLFAAGIFGVILLGDALGLYHFDSGLGSEAGGK